jgi:hypothetical protein
LAALCVASAAAADEAAAPGSGKVALTAVQVEHSDIAFAPIVNQTRSREIRAYGTVLDPSRLAESASQVAAAKAARDMAAAKLAASSAGFGRAQKLYGAEQNISKSELQAADVNYQSDRASLAAADAQLAAASAAARQAWGTLLGDAPGKGADLLRRLLGGQATLLQVTAPLDSGFAGEPRAAAIWPGRIPLTYLGPALHADPHLPGTSFLMSAAADPSLVPGATVLVQLQSAETATVAQIPEAAIVRWQAADWIYLADGKDAVARRQVATDWPTPDGAGYLVGGLPDGGRLVVRGAQLVLSEEFKAIARSGDND